MAIDVRLAAPQDLAGIGATLGRAFADDPVFEFLVPDVGTDERARRITPLFSAEARLKVKHATAWTTPEHAGAALWSEPGNVKTPMRKQWREGIAFVRAAWRRIPAGMAVLATIDELRPKVPHWYLATLGTDPGHQGRGVGSALVAAVLERCDAEGLPAYLESSKGSNIPFYERMGFEVLREVPLPRGGPSLWPMWRDPRDPRDPGHG